MERFSTTVTQRRHEKSPDAIVKVAYGHFVREPLRTYARDEVQRRDGLVVKDELIAIGDAVLARIRQLRRGEPVRRHAASSSATSSTRPRWPTPWPASWRRRRSSARKDTEIEIERKERTKREVQAAGIANAMQIIRGQLNAIYIQHEAIEAQKLMVNSPNHTTVYIPVGPMGVPLTGTFPAPSVPSRP